ncbi:gpi inositol-deacylase [Stylonychia lemnae]|uniref:GPI inositol-deacylase n=1 Tax=Stylonychia lemnae TaxID=5949 RepID=A0A078B7K8_STYLE|nr:gpi inositol-deacylase [Stylonychia lemnae]|eukprot:CDW89287.1 gpi inositol-deacylase [Stylonychia lemnae]
MYGWLAIVGIYVIFTSSTLYFANPDQYDVSLVEQLQYVEEVYFPKVSNYSFLNTHPHKMKFFRVLDYDIKTPEDIKQRSNTVLLPFSITVGNNADYYQITNIFNSLHNHTIFLNENQNDTHYRLMAYAFDLKELPSAFSQNILHEQAEFVSHCLKFLFQNGSIDYINMIGHSMGGVVNLLASQESDFPFEKIQMFINLCSPLSGQSPQYFNNDVEKLFEEILSKNEWALNYMKERIVHLNFHGGTRDGLIREEMTVESNRIGFKHQYQIVTTQLKNNYASIDHNSPMYNKRFLDTFVPGIVQISLKYQSDDGIEDIDSLIRELFEFQETSHKHQYFVQTKTTQNTTQVINYPEKKRAIEPIQNLSKIRIDLAAEYKSKNLTYQIYGLSDRRFDVTLRQTFKESEKQLNTVASRLYLPFNYYKATIQHLTSMDELYITMNLRSDQNILNDVQNFKPGNDQIDPKYFPLNEEKYQQIGMKILEYNSQNSLDQIDLLFYFMGINYDLSLTDKIYINRDKTISQLISTNLPLKICSSSQQPVIVEIKEHQDDKVMIQILNEESKCFWTYPNMIDNQKKGYISLEFYSLNQHSDSDVKINISPFYSQIFRQSIIDKIWIALYLSYLMGITYIFIESFTLVHVMPVVVLVLDFMKPQNITQYNLLDRNQFTILDITTIYTIATILMYAPDIAFYLVTSIALKPLKYLLNRDQKVSQRSNQILRLLLILLQGLFFLTDIHFFLVYLLPVATLVIKDDSIRYMKLFKIQVAYFVLSVDRMAIDHWRIREFIRGQYHYILNNPFQSEMRYMIIIVSASIIYCMYEDIITQNSRYKLYFPLVQNKKAQQSCFNWKVFGIYFFKFGLLIWYGLGLLNLSHRVFLFKFFELY